MTQSINPRLTNLKALTNLTQKIFNSKIAQAYDGRTNKSKDEQEKDKQIKEILLIGNNDTIPEITLKILLFYLVGDRLNNAIEEFIAVNKKYIAKDENRCFVRIWVIPGKAYVNGAKTKGRYIKLSNIDQDKMMNLSGFSYTVGSTLGLYTMKDGSQIKLNCKDEPEAHRAINLLLTACFDEYKMGTAEEHTYFGSPPKDTDKLKLDGITMTAKSLRIYAQDGTPKGAKVFL